jgi:hypothetical protein
MISFQAFFSRAALTCSGMTPKFTGKQARRNSVQILNKSDGEPQDLTTRLINPEHLYQDRAVPNTLDKIFGNYQK